MHTTPTGISKNMFRRSEYFHVFSFQDHTAHKNVKSLWGVFCILNVLLHYFPRATMLYNAETRHNAEVWKDINLSKR